MFKMNPAAKEFVPAHILRKRQEEAERLGDLADQLDKVDINASSKPSSNSNCLKNSDGDNLSKTVQEESPQQKDQTSGNDEANSDCRSTKNITSSHSNNHQNSNTKDCTTQEHQSNGQHMNNLNNNSDQNESEYSDQALQDLIDEEDDRFLLKAGEDICEFNGEQFIIPGDDAEYEPQPPAGYDFGNAEDNEDEDVCNAFEEFLENLPDQ